MTVDTDFKRRLQDSFRWRGDRTDPHSYADVTGWWRDPDVLRSLGPGLASLFDDAQPWVVLGIHSRGTLLGASSRRKPYRKATGRGAASISCSRRACE